MYGWKTVKPSPYLSSHLIPPVQVCITESEYDNHAQTEKTVLTFQSVQELPIRRELAFVMTDAQGDSYVIGHAEAPFPTVKVTRSHGTPAEEKAGFTYEVKLIGRKTLAKVSF